MFYQNRNESLSVSVTDNNSYFAHMHCHVEIFYVLDGMKIIGKQWARKCGISSFFKIIIASLKERARCYLRLNFTLGM